MLQTTESQILFYWGLDKNDACSFYLDLEKEDSELRTRLREYLADPYSIENTNFANDIRGKMKSNKADQPEY